MTPTHSARWLLVLVAVLVLAVNLVAWFWLGHQPSTSSYGNRHRDSFIGVWYYPTPELQAVGYWETLTINEDGTFTKHQEYNQSSETYSGTYSVTDNGLVKFSVTRVVTNHENSFDVNRTYACRVATDLHGNLLVVNLYGRGFDDVHYSSPSSGDITWRYCYTAMNPDEQYNAIETQIPEPSEPVEPYPFQPFRPADVGTSK
jgi:hypothetical protein